MGQAWLTRRALRDIDEIDRHSTDRWGSRVAGEYLSDLQGAVERLAQVPSLLQEREECSPHLRFYRVREHVLVCDVIDEDVFVLAVRHGAMDLPRRLAELEPQLVQEAELLHERLVNSRK